MKILITRTSLSHYKDEPPLKNMDFEKIETGSPFKYCKRHYWILSYPNLDVAIKSIFKYCEEHKEEFTDGYYDSTNDNYIFRDSLVISPFINKFQIEQLSNIEFRIHIYADYIE